MDRERINELILEIVEENPGDPYATYGADLLCEKIINDSPIDFSHLSKEAQDMMREFAQHEIEDEIRQAARYEFVRITHDVTPNAEAGASLMEDAFIKLLRESKQECPNPGIHEYGKVNNQWLYCPLCRVKL